MKKLNLSILDFNAMGLFNFDTWHSIFVARNIIQRLTKSAQMLSEIDADVILLQEIHTYSVLKLLRRNLFNYPYISYKPFLYGPRGGLVIFSKHPLERPIYLNFIKRGTYFNKSFITRIIKNGMIICKMKDQPIYLLNLHLTPNTDHDYYSATSRFYPYINSQLEQVADAINKLAEEKAEILIAGDFNIAKDSPLYEKFLQLSKVKDIFAAYNFPTQHQEFIPKKHQVPRMDFIFLRTSKAKTIIHETKHLFTEKVALSSGKKRYLSDHIALLTQVTFHF